MTYSAETLKGLAAMAMKLGNRDDAAHWLKELEKLENGEVSDD